MLKKVSIKYFAIFLLVFVLVSGSFPAVHATDGAYFSLGCKEAKENRLFDVEVFCTANSIKLTAAKLKFTYDTSLIELRGVTSADPKTEVVVSDNGGVANVVLINPNGIDVKEITSLFYLSFKAIDTGSAKIVFTLQQAIDTDENEIAVSAVDDLTLDITGKEITSITNKKPVKSTDNNTASSKDDNKDNSESNSFDNSSGSINASVNDNTVAAFLAGAGAVIILGAVFATAFYLGRRSKKKNKSYDDISNVAFENETDDEKNNGDE